MCGKQRFPLTESASGKRAKGPTTVEQASLPAVVGTNRRPAALTGKPQAGTPALLLKLATLIVALLPLASPARSQLGIGAPKVIVIFDGLLLDDLYNPAYPSL